jgi:glycosyltransferase involved in cell wall biosynthesis
MARELSHTESERPDHRNSTPFFTIGVTTYNRPELLRQTLVSVTHQTFSDFEVIVGNDYSQEPVSAERLGIGDSRIRFVNHPNNLGEAQNMNTLLELARGRFFTWQCDDDLYAPDFLKDVYAALVKFDFPACIFTSYEFIRGTSIPDATRTFSSKSQLFSGRRFLRMYWSGKLKAMGCTGVYDKEYLKKMGGVECLSDSSHPLYSEHLLLVRAGLEEKIVHIDQPLIRYRLHDSAWGCITNDLSIYKQAGEKLIGKCIAVFRAPALIADFRPNIDSLIKFVVADYFSKARASEGFLTRLRAAPFYFSLRKQLRSLKGSSLYWYSLLGWAMTGVRLGWWLIAKFNLKAAILPVLYSIKRILRALFRLNREQTTS